MLFHDMTCFQQVEGVLLGDIELKANMTLLGEVGHIRMTTSSDPAVFTMPSEAADVINNIRRKIFRGGKLCMQEIMVKTTCISKLIYVAAILHV